MTIQPVTNSFAVSPQIAPTDLSTIKNQGFASIICNRPDGEDANQPTYAAIAQAAQEQGLAIVHQPVVGSSITPDNVADFASHLDQLAQPVLAYCRSGTRCMVLWSQAQQAQGVAASEIIALADKAGYDMRHVVNQ